MSDRHDDAVRALTCEEAADLAPAYVLDALEPAETAAVRDHLASCQRPHPEFAALGGVVPVLLDLDPSELVEPPAGLRDRIMAAAAADLAARGERTTPAVEAIAPPGVPPPTAPIALPSAADRAARAERRGLPGTSPFDWALRIAAVVAIVLVGGWGLIVQGQLTSERQFNQAVAAVIQAAGAPGAKTVVLSPQNGYAATGLAAVRPDGSVVLAIRDLPATTGGQVYTAWAIVGTNAPVSIGDFALAGGGTSAFTTRPSQTPAGATIAVTLEPNPGNTAPKGKVVTAGVAAAPPGANG
jgi:anti-sigma-K factor RskA